jgi:ABC-2 type transport system ATP-binding protein
VDKLLRRVPIGGAQVDAVVLAEGLTKTFGAVAALDGIDLEVRGGRVLALLGPNGAGKTTTVRILSTVLKPDSGRATVLGLDVVADAAAVRTVIGLAGQYAAVDENLTGRENLRLMGRLSHQPAPVVLARADELVERFALADAAGRPVRGYSGGMRRRLDLAAALVHRPPVLFLDEPTTGLDPTGRSDLWAVIEELVTEGTTVLLTTQYLEEADRHADQIVIVDGGKVIARGTAAELKATLGRTVVEVRLPDPAGAGRAVGALRSMGPAALLDDQRTAAVTVADRGPAVLEVTRALDAAGLVPEAVVIREPTLDDAFLQLTGQVSGTGGSGAARSSTAREPQGARS